MLRRQGIGFEISKCTIFTTSTLRTTKKKQIKGATVSCREKGEAPAGIRMDGDVGGLPNKQTTACFAGEMARYLLLLMPRWSASHIPSPRWTPPPPPLHNLHVASWLSELKRTEVKNGAGSFFPVGAKEEEAAANWNFKMVLIVCTFLHSCSHLPTPPTPPTSLYLNHTSNNDFEEREERARGSTLVRSSVCRWVTDLKKKRKLLSDLHYVVWWFEGKSVSVWASPSKCCLSVNSIGITSRWLWNDSHEILLNLFLFYVMLIFFMLFLWILNDVFINWKR